MIRFCEFCGNVVREEMARCAICGCGLTQEVTEEQFNAPGSPWPFTPRETITLSIQGNPRTIRFSGTHSLYHLWLGLHRTYAAMALQYRDRNGEMELAQFPAGRAPAEFRPLEPGVILNCRHRNFSICTYHDPDPELGLEPGSLEIHYQGSFELTDCPDRDIPYVLGWLLATVPCPNHRGNWIYRI